MSSSAPSGASPRRSPRQPLCGAVSGAAAAVCVGVDDYRAHAPALAGCVGDAAALARVLGGPFAFPQVRLLLNGDATRAAVVEAVRAMADMARGGLLTQAFFSFAGHGAQVPDSPGGSEDDGRDEGLLCADGQLLRDDDLLDLLCLFPPTCSVTVVVDACHSGSVGDLPHVLWGRAPPPARAPLAPVTLLAACADASTAAEAWSVARGAPAGALTEALLVILREQAYTVTCGVLLVRLRERLAGLQVPHLSASTRLAASTLWSDVRGF